MIEFKEGRFFIGIWFLAWRDRDMLISLWTDEDATKPCNWELQYRFRYYDPEDPENDPWSGKDRKSAWQGKSQVPQTVDEAYEQMQKTVDRFKEFLSPEFCQFAPFYTSSPKDIMDAFQKLPWVHGREMTPEEYEKEYGKKETDNDR